MWYALKLLDNFNGSKQPISDKWHVVEPCSKVKGRWIFVYRTIDKAGTGGDFMTSAVMSTKTCCNQMSLLFLSCASIAQAQRELCAAHSSGVKHRHVARRSG